MTSTDTNSHEHGEAATAASASPIAAVDLDRFCDGCGYNLRTAPVLRDERTGIPIVRCTECGRFHAANDAATVFRPWLSRVTSVLLILWVVLLIDIIGGLGLLQGVLSYATLDELTGYQWTAPAATTQLALATIPRGGMTGTMVVRSIPYEGPFVGLMIFLSFLAALICGAVPTVAFPHWRRPAYIALCLAIPLLAGAIVFLTWRSEAPHLSDWGFPYMVGHAAAQVCGGLLGAVFGRPLTRQIVCICLPPSLRPRLSWLWLVDHKPLPKS